MSETRNSGLFSFVGINGTGKTTLALKMAMATHKKIIYLLPDFSDMKTDVYKELKVFDFKGIRKLLYSKDNMQLIKENFRNGVLFFDDVKMLIPSNLEHDKELYYMLIRRRQLNIDLFFVSHGFTEIPPKLFTFINYFIIFETVDNIDRFRKYINNFDKFKQITNTVNIITKEKKYFYKVYENKALS